jgi:hypothetical protein
MEDARDGVELFLTDDLAKDQAALAFCAPASSNVASPSAL